MLQALKNYYHLLQAFFANIRYGFPSKHIKVIGVTGTDGKTTTTSLIYHILKKSGRKVSMVSTVYAEIAGQEYDTGFHVTSPDPMDIQKFLRKSADAGDEFFVLETTSHGIDQNRIWGVQYAAAVLTNVTHEHLDYHQTYESYVKVKSRLLMQAQTTITNADDNSFALISAFVTKPLKTYALHKPADYSVNIAEKLGVVIPEYNNYNCLAAYAVCKELGLTDFEIFEALKTYKLPPGRLEVISTEPVTVIVDFAHTPNSIEKLLKYLRKQKPEARIIHVFGSAGRRDKTKRPLMGAASGSYANLVILTEEDYRDEDPVKISADIAVGLNNHGFQEVSPEVFGSADKQFTVIVNRMEAVLKAKAIAKNGDVVLFTGKGHEQSLCRGDKEEPWNDIDEVRKVFTNKSKV